MNIEKVEIKPNQYVWVDKDAEIKENDWFYLNDANIIAQYKTNITNGAVKIVVASPELNLEGIPTYVEWLAEQSYPISEVWNDERSLIRKLAFIRGYQTAEKELLNRPTWQDVANAIAIARRWDKMSTEQILELFKQEKNNL